MRATLALNGLSQTWYSVNIFIRAVVSHQEWVTYFKKLKEKLSVVDELLFTLVNKFLKFFLKCTVKNAKISPFSLVWKFCRNTEFLQSCGRFARNSTETVHFHKISTPGY